MPPDRLKSTPETVIPLKMSGLRCGEVPRLGPTAAQQGHPAQNERAPLRPVRSCRGITRHPAQNERAPLRRKIPAVHPGMAARPVIPLKMSGLRCGPGPHPG